ncbi:MAG TPA: hypothetical protein VMF13_12255 [Luteitalea sp.]|nr:hypothetical protein [Luteitalea sp.]
MRLIDRHPPDADLAALLDSEGTLRLVGDVDAHVRACPSCAARMSTMRASSRRVAHLLTRTAAGSSHTSQRARLQMALRDVSAPGAASVSTSTTWSDPWLKVAALVLVVLAGAVLATMLVDRRAERPTGSIAAGFGAPTLPSSAATPGAVSALTAQELCGGQRPSRLVDDETRRRVLADYDMADVSAEEYELDALITPELGGTTAAENLWPQRYDSPIWNAAVKDDLERLLPAMVCRGEIDLATAQRAIAHDWIAAYKQFFRTDAPLIVDRSQPDDDDLILASASYRP